MTHLDMGGGGATVHIHIGALIVISVFTCSSSSFCCSADAIADSVSSSSIVSLAEDPVTSEFSLYVSVVSSCSRPRVCQKEAHRLATDEDICSFSLNSSNVYTSVIGKTVNNNHSNTYLAWKYIPFSWNAIITATLIGDVLKEAVFPQSSSISMSTWPNWHKPRIN